MSHTPVKSPTNLDFQGNLRGKCKDNNCDCTQYYKCEGNNVCAVCGCFPGKHELIAVASTTLNAAMNDALSMLSTPSKIAEIDIDTGNIVLHSSKGIKRKLDLNSVDKPTKSNKVTAVQTNKGEQNRFGITDPIRGVGRLIEEQEDDPMETRSDDDKDPDYEPDAENQTGETKTEEKKTQETVVTTRKATDEGSAFLPSDIKRRFLSLDLEEKIKIGGILLHENAFVSEAASYLLSLSKKEKPSPSEQTVFCSKIVEYFQGLKTTKGTNPWSAFKTTLSRHLIQRRFRAKTPKSATASSVKSCAFVPAEPEDEQDLEDQVKKLKEITSRSSDATVRALIEHTSTHRRLAIATSDKNTPPRQLMEIWPHLSVAEWLIHDFCSFKELKGNELEDNINLFLRRLSTMLAEEETERGFAESLLLMAKKLNKQSKRMRDILIIIEPLGSLEPLQSKEIDEAPRLVLMAGTSDIRQCYLLVDSKRLELAPPVTTQRAVALLMAAYFVFDVQYPAPYLNFLTVLDIECGKRPDTVKVTQRLLYKFLRDLSQTHPHAANP